MKEEQLEGELIKKQVEEELERERMRDAERLKRAAKTREEFKKANEDLLKIQAEIALKEKEEERRRTYRRPCAAGFLAAGCKSSYSSLLP